jgi:hypothetical protein
VWITIGGEIPTGFLRELAQSTIQQCHKRPPFKYVSLLAPLEGISCVDRSALV